MPQCANVEPASRPVLIRHTQVERIANARCATISICWVQLSRLWFCIRHNDIGFGDNATILSTSIYFGFFLFFKHFHCDTVARQFSVHFFLDFCLSLSLSFNYAFSLLKCCILGKSLSRMSSQSKWFTSLQNYQHV